MNELLRKTRRGLFSLRQDGFRRTGSRVARTLGTRLAGSPVFPIEDQYIADSALVRPVVRGPVAGRPLRVGWVCTPPARGSGGHTTLFRMVRALEAKGHECTLFLYDRFHGEIASHERLIRLSWPDLAAKVKDARYALTGVDALVATGWESAHVVATAGPVDTARLYFIQDYEPLFYPAGFQKALAEDSYRFGFRMVSLGGMIAARLTELGLGSDVVHFGCDVETYRLLPATGPRRGVICYMRPTNPRRGFDLARLTLTQFYRDFPEVPIHLYGADVRDVGFPATVSPHLATKDLNVLYNSAVAGLVLSFTNVSLVPEELLRAGVVPVVNECGDAAMVLTNPNVVWGRSTPHALAAALGRVVSADFSATHAQDLSDSVESRWDTTEREVTSVIEDEVYVGSAGKRRLGHGDLDIEP